MTTSGSRAGHAGADGSDPASADQGGTRGPGRPYPSRGRHSADRGGRPPDDPDYEDDVYRDLYRQPDGQPQDDGYPRNDGYPQNGSYQETERHHERPGGYREDDRYRGHQGGDRYRDDDAGRDRDDEADTHRDHPDDVYNSLYRPEDRPRQPRGYRESEHYDQPRGYTRTGGRPPTGKYDENDPHPAGEAGEPPRPGTDP